MKNQNDDTPWWGSVASCWQIYDPLQQMPIICHYYYKFIFERKKLHWFKYCKWRQRGVEKQEQPRENNHPDRDHKLLRSAQVIQNLIDFFSAEVFQFHLIVLNANYLLSEVNSPFIFGFWLKYNLPVTIGKLPAGKYHEIRVIFPLKAPN